VILLETEAENESDSKCRAAEALALATDGVNLLQTAAGQLKEAVIGSFVVCLL
jgi:hypothetical protein